MLFSGVTIGCSSNTNSTSMKAEESDKNESKLSVFSCKKNGKEVTFLREYNYQGYKRYGRYEYVSSVRSPSLKKEPNKLEKPCLPISDYACSVKNQIVDLLKLQEILFSLFKPNKEEKVKILITASPGSSTTKIIKNDGCTILVLVHIADEYYGFGLDSRSNGVHSYFYEGLYCSLEKDIFNLKCKDDCILTKVVFVGFENSRLLVCLFEKLIDKKVEVYYLSYNRNADTESYIVNENDKKKILDNKAFKMLRESDYLVKYLGVIKLIYSEECLKKE